MDVSKEVSEVIGVLSDKFGATVQHLWEIMVRQQMDADSEFSSKRRPDCPLREVPEWTAEDAKAVRNFLAAQKHWYETIKQITENPECQTEKAAKQVIKAIEKLCQLAGVEVEE